MPSSISSSDLKPASKPLHPRQAIALLIVIAFSLYGVAELAANIGLGRFSQIHRRIIQERVATGDVHPAPPGQPPTVLLVGNSLLLEDVDFPQLKERLSSRFHLSRFVVEQTSYFDWEFGLRRLFRHGSRPDYVVLCLSPGQFRSNDIRGDFDARFLFDIQDIWPLSRAIDANLTTTTGLYFAHISTFYGARSELRNVLLGKMGFQAIALLMHDLVTVPLVESERDMTPAYATRLEALQRLCAASGVKFAFLIPPTRQPGDKEMARAGEWKGVPVMHPVANYSLGPELYRDGFHLNAAGAKIFTAAVGDALVSAL
jgi:hypothetical protein